MKVVDERAWAEQLTEFKADELSRKFGDFLIFWCETAESFIKEAGPEDETVIDSEIHYQFSKALHLAEQTFGYLSVEWIAQMLLVTIQHWVFGEQLLSSLSFIETRLVEQATALKLVELQTTASIASEE